MYVYKIFRYGNLREEAAVIGVYGTNEVFCLWQLQIQIP